MTKNEEKPRILEEEREKREKREMEELTKALIEFLKDYRTGTLED
tara:strand:+ start:1175 stop:1309 length:135 start_codon:yes stop_codon:yes gene_type:complete